ncbi:MAG: ATP-grasp domain-containing protein [Planctomycetes bacterium]|nr:ATP-grasp domain-containing protein [Planctomycetota bacterium]
MNITLLVYLENGSEEHDSSVDEIADALREAGHKPSIFGVRGDLNKLIAGLRRRRPDLIFNLLEQFNDQQLGLVEATAVLELLGIPYTGGGAGELFLQEDKTLTKKLLAYEGLLYPDFAVFSKEAELETGGNLRLPLFVKPLRLDSSLGIEGSKSLVRTTTELMEQVLRIHRELNDAALCEEYIDGREFYIGVLGNHEPLAFPPIEIDFSEMPEDAPHVLDAKAKFDQSTPEYQGTKPVVAEIDDQLRARLQQVALDACRALRVKDYARVDLRVAETGDIYILEVNANCYLERESEYAMAAAAAGIEYTDLIGRIVEHALERRKIKSRRIGARRTKSRKPKRPAPV